MTPRPLLLTAIVVLTLFGCGDSSAPTKSTTSETKAPPTSQGTPSGTDSQETTVPATAAAPQTVAGGGFTFDMPSGWTVISQSPELGIASPDYVPITFLKHPTQGVPVGELATNVANNHKLVGDVESDTQIKVGGREARRVVMKLEAGTPDASQSMLIVVPLDSEVLTIGSFVLESKASAHIPRVDAIVETIQWQ